jgi:hypothetical protein
MLYFASQPGMLLQPPPYSGPGYHLGRPSSPPRLSASVAVLLLVRDFTPPRVDCGPYSEPRNTLAPRPARVLSPMASLNWSKGNTLPAGVERGLETRAGQQSGI